MVRKEKVDALLCKGGRNSASLGCRILLDRTGISKCFFFPLPAAAGDRFTGGGRNVVVNVPPVPALSSRVAGERRVFRHGCCWVRRVVGSFCLEFVVSLVYSLLAIGSGAFSFCEDVQAAQTLMAVYMSAVSRYRQRTIQTRILLLCCILFLCLVILSLGVGHSWHLL